MSKFRGKQLQLAYPDLFLGFLCQKLRPFSYIIFSHKAPLFFCP